MGELLRGPWEDWAMTPGRRKQAPQEKAAMPFFESDWKPPRKDTTVVSRPGRGRTVQAFLAPEEKEAFIRYCKHIGMDQGICVRWLILDAMKTSKVPEEEI